MSLTSHAVMNPVDRVSMAHTRNRTMTPAQIVGETLADKYNRPPRCMSGHQVASAFAGYDFEKRWLAKAERGEFDKLNQDMRVCRSLFVMCHKSTDDTEVQSRLNELVELTIEIADRHELPSMPELRGAVACIA